MINNIINECSKQVKKETQDWVGISIYREQCKGSSFGHTNKIYIQEIDFILEKEDAENSLGFSDRSRWRILAWRIDLEWIKKNKIICFLGDLAVSANKWVKIKESEMMVTCVDLTRKLKKRWNMKVIVMAFVVRALGTVCKGLEKSLDQLKFIGRIETIQTIALIRWIWILWKVLETWEHLLSFRPPVKNWVKDYKEWNNNNNNSLGFCDHLMLTKRLDLVTINKNWKPSIIWTLPFRCS